MSRPIAVAVREPKYTAATAATTWPSATAKHHPAGGHDVAGIGLDNAVVDDVRVQRGQVQRRDGLRKLCDHHDKEPLAVTARELANQSEQLGRSLSVRDCLKAFNRMLVVLRVQPDQCERFCAGQTASALQFSQRCPQPRPARSRQPWRWCLSPLFAWSRKRRVRSSKSWTRILVSGATLFSSLTVPQLVQAAPSGADGSQSGTVPGPAPVSLPTLTPRTIHAEINKNM
jgi:hypothetical protein